MYLNLSEDEQMLKALVERFVQDHYDIDKRRAYLREPLGFSPQLWSLVGELGLIAAPFRGDDGGGDLDATALAVIFEAMGYGLAVEPLIENVVWAGLTFADSASAALRDKWLDGIVSGERRIAIAHAEAGARDGGLWLETQAAPRDGGYILSGEKAYVPAGAGVDGFLVSARVAGAPSSPEDADFYFVPADAPGLSVTPWRMVDGGAAVSLKLDRVKVGADNILSGGVGAVDRASTLANLARAAEALGIMQRIFNDTLDYLRTREQFGVKLGSFQAIQHRMVAQYAAIEQARGLVNLALVSWGKADFASAVAGARAFISHASVELGHEMMQFHGGMGVTDELLIGHGHKRLVALSRWPDSPEAALDRFAGNAA